MGKKILIFLAVFLGAVFVWMLWTDYAREQEQQARAEQLEMELRPLNVELRSLKQELKDQEEYYAICINGMAAATLLFTGSEDAVCTEAWLRMESYEFCGVIVLSPESFSETEGYMDTDQLIKLREAGWDWCIGWPSDSTDPMSDCAALAALAEDAGLGGTSYIWFSEEGEAEAYQDRLLADGYKAITATDWRSSDRRNVFEQAVQEGGNMAYSISIGHTVGKTLSEDLDYFDSMLKWLEGYCAVGSAKIVTLEEAEAYRLEVEVDKERFQEEWESVKAGLEARIAELEAQIKVIQDEYSDYLP